MENVDSIVPEHATDTARELASTTEFWEGYRRGGFSPDVENPYPEPDYPTPADPHTRFAFGQNRATAQEREPNPDGPGFSQKRPLLSRHSVGADRWFWIVAGDWDMVHFWHGIDLLHHGIEPTAEKAEAAAREIYPDADPPRSVAKDARRYWDMLKARERQAEDKQTGGSKRMEFVYGVYSLPERSGLYLEKHRHIKTTEKRIFIAEERWEREQDRLGSWRDYDKNRLSLDREEMETEGFVRRRIKRGNSRRFFLSYEDAVEHMKSDTPGGAANDTPPECLHVLGLEAGATEADVKEAFRAQSKELHPDHGGDAAAFRRLRDAYEDALETV